MGNKYSISEYIKNIYSFVTTKLTLRQARFVRRPVYIRGKKSIAGCKNITMGRYCRFDLEGNKKTLFIGKNCEMGDMTHIVAHNHVEIGDDVLIASKCFISDTSHGVYSGEVQSSPLQPPNERNLKKTYVNIGNHVWIGENACILAGVTIGTGSIIGANAVVNKDVPECSIAAGCPAKIVKQWNADNEKWIRYNKS